MKKNLILGASSPKGKTLLTHLQAIKETYSNLLFCSKSKKIIFF